MPKPGGSWQLAIPPAARRPGGGQLRPGLRLPLTCICITLLSTALAAPVSIPLRVLANYYYGLDLAVTFNDAHIRSTTTIPNVLVDTGSRRTYLQKCPDGVNCLTIEDQDCFPFNNELGQYISISLTSCYSLLGNLTFTTTTNNEPLITYSAFRLANLSLDNITEPGAFTYTPPSQPFTLGGLLGLASDSEASLIFGRTVRDTAGIGDDSKMTSLYALDLNEGDGTLVLGGYDTATYGDKLKWGMPIMGVQSPNYHAIPIFLPSVCGVPIFGDLSSNWLAVVDTLSPCLSLPGDAFDSFRGWALSHRVCTQDGYDNFMCYTDAVNDLPPLTFQLAETGPTLVLPLASLLLPSQDNHGRRGLCVLRTPSLASNVDDYESRVVQLGTMALRSFYVVVDKDRQRVGLANKGAAASMSTTGPWPGCSKPVTCIGQQQYQEQYNTCAPPGCEIYLFQSLHTQTQTCQFTATFKAAAVVLLSIIVMVELAAHWWRQAASAKYRHYHQLPTPQRRRGGGGDGGSGRSLFSVVVSR